MATPSRYWREIPQRYRLEANRCDACEKIFFPPRLICPGCGNRELKAVKLKDTGKVLTYTVIHTPPHKFEDQAPYAMGIVELDDGARVTGQIVDCEFEKLAIGMPVRIEFRKIFNEGESGIICYGYKFVPA